MPNLALLYLFPFIVLTTLGHDTPCGVPAISTRLLSKSNRIYGGSEADPHSFPWHVFIKTPRGSYSGALVAHGSSNQSDIVITSSVILQKPKGGLFTEKQLLVSLGIHDRASKALEVRKVKEVKVNKPLVDNPAIPEKSQPTAAILKLQTPVSYTQHIRPICLQTGKERMRHTRMCLVTGLNHFAYDVPLKNFVYVANIQRMPSSKCQEHFPYYHRANYFCAGTMSTNMCPGDTGSPVVCYWKDHWVLFGFNVLPTDCKLALYTPSLFSRDTYADRTLDIPPLANPPTLSSKSADSLSVEDSKEVKPVKPEPVQPPVVIPGQPDDGLAKPVDPDAKPDGSGDGGAQPVLPNPGQQQPDDAPADADQPSSQPGDDEPVEEKVSEPGAKKSASAVKAAPSVSVEGQSTDIAAVVARTRQQSLPETPDDISVAIRVTTARSKRVPLTVLPEPRSIKFDRVSAKRIRTKLRADAADQPDFPEANSRTVIPANAPIGQNSKPAQRIFGEGRETRSSKLAKDVKFDESANQSAKGGNSDEEKQAGDQPSSQPSGSKVRAAKPVDDAGADAAVEGEKKKKKKTKTTDDGEKKERRRKKQADQ